MNQNRHNRCFYSGYALKFCVVIIIQGGGVAAPVAGQILGEVLPYLEVYKAENEDIQNINMPDVVGLTIKEAKEVLEGFEVEIQAEEFSNEDTITKQIPEAGIEINQNGKILLYIN